MNSIGSVLASNKRAFDKARIIIEEQEQAKIAELKIELAQPEQRQLLLSKMAQVGIDALMQIRDARKYWSPMTVLDLAKFSNLSRPTIYEHLNTELGESLAFDRVFVGTVTRLWAALGFELILSLRPKDGEEDEAISA